MEKAQVSSNMLTSVHVTGHVILAGKNVEPARTRSCSLKCEPRFILARNLQRDPGTIDCGNISGPRGKTSAKSGGTC